jgi:hypothetical protein
VTTTQRSEAYTLTGEARDRAAAAARRCFRGRFDHDAEPVVHTTVSGDGVWVEGLVFVSAEEMAS